MASKALGTPTRNARTANVAPMILGAVQVEEASESMEDSARVEVGSAVDDTPQLLPDSEVFMEERREASGIAVESMKLIVGMAMLQQTMSSKAQVCMGLQCAFWQRCRTATKLIWYLLTCHGSLLIPFRYV